MATLTRQYNRSSKKSSHHLVKMVMQVLSMTNAAAYANEELQVALNSDNVIDINEINKFSRGFIRLKLLKHMGAFYQLPDDIVAAIINLQIAKDFGSVPNPAVRQIMPATRPVESSHVKTKPITPFGRKTK